MINKLMIILFTLIVVLFSTQGRADQQVLVFTDISQLEPLLDEDSAVAVIIPAKDLPSVSLFIKRVEFKGSKSKNSEQRKYKLVGKALRIDFKESQEVAIFKIPPGTYQVYEVEVPHFDLPYAVETADDDRWRFTVKRNHINYLANLKVSDIRSRNSVQINWLNKLATNLPELTRIQEQFPKPWPLAHGVGYQDDFFEILSRQP